MNEPVDLYTRRLPLECRKPATFLYIETTQNSGKSLKCQNVIISEDQKARETTFKNEIGSHSEIRIRIKVPVTLRHQQL